MNDFKLYSIHPPFQIHPDEELKPEPEPALAPVLSGEGRIPDPIDARLAALARRAQGGDVPARNALFLALWPRYAPVLRRLRRSDYWRSIEGRSWTFDDLDQEAFIVFCELVAAWRSDEPRFAGYFFSRFPWRMRDALRRWTTPTRLDRPISESSENDLYVDPSDAIELRATIDALFAELTDRDRQLLHLRVVDGLTDREIAAAFGVSVKTARRWRKLAFAHARAALGE